MNTCQKLWESYEALKQAKAYTENMLNEGKKLSIADFDLAIEKLSKAKFEYNDSFYTKLPNGRIIYTLDYLSLIQICDTSRLTLDKLLLEQPEDFLNHNLRINSLIINQRGIKKLDITALTDLTKLDCSYNDLPLIDISRNIKLEEFDCRGNRIYSLKITKNPALRILKFSNNEIHSIDISKNLDLTHIYCSKNRLTTISTFKALPNLKVVVADGNYKLNFKSKTLAKSKGWKI